MEVFALIMLMLVDAGISIWVLVSRVGSDDKD